MKPRNVLIVLCAATTMAALSATLYHRHTAASALVAAGVRTFSVTGEIRGVDPVAKTVRIRHEEIPDYMPAMTMPFSVRDAKLLDKLAPGDRVRFELRVSSDDSWVSRIEKLSGGAGEAGGDPPATAADREADRVHLGERLPDFSLIDQDGRAVRLSDFRGRMVVLTFIYTRCPLPNFCPLMSRNFAELQQRLGKAFPGRCALLSVTMDWQFDRPDVLKQYAERYGADEKIWTFATGSEEQIGFVANLLGLFYQPENGLISHDFRTALIGPDGRLLQLWKSNVWTPDEVQRRIAENLEGSNGFAASAPAGSGAGK